MGAPEDPPRVIELRLAIDADDDPAVLRGALLAARATELSESRRRGARHSFGYGSDSAREQMSAEAERAERRGALLERLIGALDAAAAGDTRD